MNQPILLLSATIHCEDTPFVRRRDPKLREADYMWAIEGWLRVEGYETLIFCENSGAELSKIKEYSSKLNVLNRRLVFLSCAKNLGASRRGKGYGEMEIIRHALDADMDIGPERTLLKVTGRYRARNASRVLTYIGTMQSEICSDMRLNLTFADSGLFAINVGCARRRLLPRQDDLDDLGNKSFEHVLADTIHEAILAGERWSPMPCDPSLYGYSGTYGVRVGQSPLSRIKSMTKHFLARKVFSDF